MHWKLKVSEYGKIKSAEIEIAPLTLFVGDNNSGKSYLMSLLWAIQNLGLVELFGNGYKPDAKVTRTINDWLRRQIEATCKENMNVHTVSVNEIAKDLQTVLQAALNRNKNKLASRIFNSQDVKIKELEIELTGLEEVLLNFKRIEAAEGYGMTIQSNVEGVGVINVSPSGLENINNTSDDFLTGLLLSLVTGISLLGVSEDNSSIFLPAARTGFMLTKDIINKVGRNTAFNIGMGQREIAPFTRPINHFLDVMNDLTFDTKGRKEFDAIVRYLENGMAEGTVEMSTLPNKEVSYVPVGGKKGIPLRAVSAVVTELSPLILILKHNLNLQTLFYEEPEMCLHPQLQQKMGRVICRLINAGVNMMVTTHSDILLQHINNMISLSGREDVEKLCQSLNYTSRDLLNAKQIKVYQLKCKPGEMTEVEELECGKNGFAIPTFNDALDSIMEEAYTIQE